MVWVLPCLSPPCPVKLIYWMIFIACNASRSRGSACRLHPCMSLTANLWPMQSRWMGGSCGWTPPCSPRPWSRTGTFPQRTATPSTCRGSATAASMQPPRSTSPQVSAPTPCHLLCYIDPLQELSPHQCLCPANCRIQLACTFLPGVVTMLVTKTTFVLSRGCDLHLLAQL